MRHEKNIIEVSLGILIHNGFIFIQKRETNDQFNGKWEFPGGKLNEKELPIDCLKRELFEEINFIPKNIEKITDFKYIYENLEINFHLFLCNVENIEKINTKLSLKWINVNEIMDYDFPEANLKFIPLILKQLKISMELI